jgi:hypothetical protein
MTGWLSCAHVITAGLIIWPDRTSSPAWQTVAAGLLSAWSGHEDVRRAWHWSWWA